MIRSTLFFAILIIMLSCGKEQAEGEMSTGDYRDAYIGMYNCTKSYESFDDPSPLNNISVIVEIDTTAENNILVNDFSVVLLDDGTFGEGALEGSIDDDFIQFYHRPIVNGIILPCYIQGWKE